MRVPTSNPRIQVTVDDELAHAMARADPDPASRSRLVRDLAVRGARALEEEWAESKLALRVLIEIADGTRDYDFDAAADLAARRSDRLP
ncbi:MAG: hypothetical protein QOJ89_3887 [bacterium]|jgi:hypothetical protein